MKIGILSDAHGNFISLKRCMNIFKAERTDLIIYLGDAYGYFPDGNKVMDYLFEHKVHCLMGNHEAMLIGQLPLSKEKDKVYQLRKNEINEDTKKVISNLSSSLEMTVNKKKLLFMHGNPKDTLQGYCYPEDNLKDFLPMKYDYVFMGHTHRAFIRKEERISFVNVGSCGLPRDIGNEPSICIFDTISENLNIFRTKIIIADILNEYPNIHSTVKECLMRRKN